jgi:primosomal protein N' (replication factor Y) (superfamily II helicase)
LTEKNINKYAQVAFPLTSFRHFTYLIPVNYINEIKIGSCVLAPIRNNERIGFVVNISNNTDFKGKIQELKGRLEKDLSIPKNLWDTLNWISFYYFCSIGKVIKSAIPLSFKTNLKPKKVSYVKITKLGLENISKLKKNAISQLEILKALSIVDEPIKVASLKIISVSYSAICNKLSENGFVEISHKTEIYNPLDIIQFSILKKIELNDEQANAYNIINQNFEKDIFSINYIHGITGSGKTEIYIKLADSIIKKGQSVIMLVPEIALTPQISARFKLYFGNKIALWHSKLTSAEKSWTWKEIKKGTFSIIIGARSALFSPMKNLGLIIIDEEHDYSYKQDRVAPYYHARNTALMRAKFANIPIVLGSATPSMEMYYQKISKKITWTILDKRYGNANLPSVQMVDMIEEMKKVDDFSSHLSTELKKSIQNCLNKNEQLILMLNRRGYAVVQQCIGCGNISSCPQCSVSLTYHRNGEKLICHYCDYKIEILHNCSECGSNEIHFLGSGTQKIEEELIENFPSAKVLRMDIDTVQSKGGHYEILEKFGNKEADILLGTQMIAKGLDFPDVTLVGVINADTGVFMPDFRAGERNFQLIYQVAGRAGRHKKPGKAIIQTYNPQEMSITMAAHQNLKQFYNATMSQRYDLNYPPFSRLARFVCSGFDKILVKKRIYSIFYLLKKIDALTILGPSIAPIEKIRNSWRYHILIKYDINTPHVLHNNIRNQILVLLDKPVNNVKTQIDIDPISIL